MWMYLQNQAQMMNLCVSHQYSLRGTTAQEAFQGQLEKMNYLVEITALLSVAY